MTIYDDREIKLKKEIMRIGRFYQDEYLKAIKPLSDELLFIMQAKPRSFTISKEELEKLGMTVGDLKGMQ